MEQKARVLKSKTERKGVSMRFLSSIGKYQLGQTIGEGTFAKVKLARDTTNGQFVAIKIINKQMVIENNLIYQVEREIKSMKLLNHPNIVRIHEVLGTKSKIYIVMEYISGGQLSDKMSYSGRLSEKEARKYFQQLIDAIDHCHCRGVYHRDLKVSTESYSLRPKMYDRISSRTRSNSVIHFGTEPQNLLLDKKGNLKISDFGLSALRKPGFLLSTACGSPSYVAPELITDSLYDGTAADVWSCGVILFELLAGYLPFQDRSLINLYRKICRAEYTFPPWFTEDLKKLICRLLDPYPRSRLTMPEIVENQWFQTDYASAMGIECKEAIGMADVRTAISSTKENEAEEKMTRTPSFINAFQLIAMSRDLDLSGLFEEQGDQKRKTKVGSKHTVNETIEKIEAAAKHVSLVVDRTNNCKMKMHLKQKMTRDSRLFFDLSAKVIEIAPTHCVVEISKSAGELGLYKEFCRTLLSMLRKEPDMPLAMQEPHEDSANSVTQELEWLS